MDDYELQLNEGKRGRVDVFDGQTLIKKMTITDCVTNDRYEIQDLIRKAIYGIISLY